MNIQELRAKYPEYNDLDDEKLVTGFHSKFYSDIPLDQFKSKLGFKQEEPSYLARLASDIKDDTVNDLSTMGQGIYTAGKGFLGSALGGLNMVANLPRGLGPAVEAGNNMQGFISETLPFVSKEKELNEVMSAGFEGVTNAAKRGGVAAVSALPFAGPELANKYENEIEFGSEMAANLLMPIPGAKGVSKAVADARAIASKGKTKGTDIPSVDRRKAIDEELSTDYTKAYEISLKPGETNDGIPRRMGINETPEELAFWKARADQMEQQARETPLQVTKEGLAVPRELEAATKAIDEQKPTAPQYGVETPKTQEVFGYTTELKPKVEDYTARGELKIQDPTTAMATNHTMPTNEFLLRPEYLNADPTVQTLLRQEAQRLTEAEKGGKNGAEAAKELRAIREELERHGWEGYGSGEKPGLFGFGKETALPIEKTGTRDTRSFPNAGKPLVEGRDTRGRFVPKSQRGAIHPDLIGAGKVVDLLAKLGSTNLLGKFKGTFSNSALKYAINDSLDPKSRSRLVWMSPSKFLELARDRFPASRPDLTQQMRDAAAPKIRSIREGLRSKDGLHALPEIVLDRGKVTIHNGRHRAHTFDKMGVDLIPVELRDSMHRVEDGPLPYHQVLSENGKVIDISDIKEVFPNGQRQLGQSRAGNSQRGSVPDVGESPLLKGLFKAFEKKENVEPTKFEGQVSTQEATKALPGTGKVFDGVSNVPLEPSKFLEKYSTDFAPENDLTAGQLRTGLTVQSGSNVKARNTNNAAVKYAYQAYDAAYTAASVLKNTFVDPIAKLEAKVGAAERADLAYLAKKVEGTSRVVDREFLQRKGFSEEGIRFWEAVQAGLKAKLEHTNSILGQIGKEQVTPRSNYFASTFKGQYKAVVRDKTTGDPVFVLAETTPRKLDKLLESFKSKKGKEFDFDVLNFDYVKHNKGEVEFALNEFNRLAEKGDPRIEGLKSLYEEYQQLTASYNKGGNQHLKAKSKEAVGGAEGYRFDRTEAQNAKDFWKAQLEYIEKGFIWGENQKMYHNVGEVIKGIEEKMPNTSTYMNQYRLNAIGVRRNTLGKMSDILEKEITNWGIPVRTMAEWSKGTLNSMLLGGPTNVVFAATQLIQVINATPDIRIMLEKRGISPTEAAISATKSLNFNNAITQEAFNWAKTNHVARSAVFGDTVELGSSKAARAADMAGNVWNGLPKLADAGGRSYVFVNAVHMLMDSGMPKKEAFQTAADLTNRAMVDYRAPESPMMMSSGGLIGNTSMFLMKYPANWWSQFFSHLSNKDATSVATLLTAVGMTAGALGLPGIEQYEAIRSIWNSAFGTKGHRLPSANELALKSGMPDWATIGPLSTATGVDFSSKTGMRDTVGNSITDVVLPGSGFLGKAAAGVASVATSPTDVSKWKHAAHEVMPTSLKGITENAFYTKNTAPDGRALFTNPNTGEGEYRRNSFDKNIRYFGGRSTDEALAKAKSFSDTTETKEKQALMTKIVDNTAKQLNSTSNTFEKNKIVQDAAKVYVKYGGTPEGFFSSLTEEVKKSMMTPEERKRLQSNPQRLKQYMEYR